MKHAHFDCVSGVAGDMTLAALVSAGWPVAELEALPARLRLEGVRVQVSDVRRGPFAAKHVRVDYPEQQPHRHLHHIEAILDQADLPVAEECLVTARTMGSRAELIADVGVAGLHRLLSHRQRLRDARVLVVVAGLEGALPSVVGGLTDRPLIAVPTSIGYGSHMKGVAPLLAMLNSCAAGVTVVNIDNGFGAGYAAHLINARRS